MKNGVGVWILTALIQSCLCPVLMMLQVTFKSLAVFYNDRHSFTVKLWHTNMQNSVASIEAKANVCCVKFNPESPYHLAYGCAGVISMLSHLFDSLPIFRSLRSLL
jgi:hypothetical protein